MANDKTQKGIGQRAKEAIGDAVAKLATGTGAGSAGNAEGGSDERLERAEEFAEAAVEHLDHVTDEAGKADYEQAKLNQVDRFELLPENAPSFQLRFADGEAFVPQAIELAADDLKPDGGARVTYAKAVDFPPEGEPSVVREAWLIAASGEAVCCAVSTPGLRCGGGYHVRLPAGHLLF